MREYKEDVFRKNFCKLPDGRDRELRLDLADRLPEDPGLVVIQQVAAIRAKAVRIMELMLVPPDTIERIGEEVSLAAMEAIWSGCGVDDIVLDDSLKEGNIGFKIVLSHEIPEPKEAQESFLNDRLIDVETDGRTIAKAKSSMFFSEWSFDFVHGADAMTYFTELAEQLLQDGEKFKSLKSVRFRRPIMNNLDIVIVDNGVVPASYSGREVVMSGSFETSGGRELSFYGFDDVNSPISIRAKRNPYPMFFKRRFADGNSVEGIGAMVSLPCLCPETDFECRNKKFYEAMKDPRAILATLMDLITNLVLDIELEGINASDFELRIASSFENVPLPENIRELFNEYGNGSAVSCTIRQLVDEQKVSRTGVLMVPIEVKFYGNGKEIVSKIVLGLTDESGVVEKFCGKQQ